MTRKGCRITDFCGHILWDIANMVMVEGNDCCHKRKFLS